MGEKTLRLCPTERSLVDTVKEAISLVEIQAKKKNLEIKLNVPDSEWNPIVSTDHNRLLQIMANLLSNALKFTI